MNNFFKNYWKNIVFVIGISLFIFMAIMLINSDLSDFDNFIYKYVTYFRNDYITMFFKFISFLCSIWFISFVTVLLMVFNKRKKYTFYIVLNVLICFLLNQSFKFLFARSRPININLINERGYSFPSAHSMVSVAFYGLFIYIIFHIKMKKSKKYIICIFLALLALLIGISRIYLGVHYASDVLAGFGLSLSYLMIFIKCFYKRIKT